jgi:SET domain-containing protein
MSKSPTTVFDLQVKRSRTGLGLFTFSPIQKGQTVIECVGERIRHGDKGSYNNRYLMDLNSRWYLDGRPRWNLGRYLNHSCRPNCQLVSTGRRIFAESRRDIGAGEELTIDYGKEYFDTYIRPRGCRCEKCRQG